MSAVTAWTTTRTKDQIVETLGGKVPVAPVNTVEDIYADPHVRARNMLVEVDHPGVSHPLTIANSPIKFADAPPTQIRRAPLLGEHTDEVLAQFDNATTAFQLEETR
jgi:crotonobetainyl-CoA:carnitine CoA-transferase CaiB-like acyl-CoA transferase